jgi:heterodisulfide reductase subunit C
MKPRCKLIGENGNVFNLIAIVRNTLRAEGLESELKVFHEEFLTLTENGGTYDDVLNLISKFVEVV